MSCSICSVSLALVRALSMLEQLLFDHRPFRDASSMIGRRYPEVNSVPYLVAVLGVISLFIGLLRYETGQQTAEVAIALGLLLILSFGVWRATVWMRSKPSALRGQSDKRGRERLGSLFD